MLARSAFQPRKRERTKQPDPKRCPPYLKWLRRLPCFLSHHDRPHQCEGIVQACHFDPWGDKGMGTKASDMAAMPMCGAGHIEQTDILGWPEFQRKYEFDGRDVVTAYWTEFLKTREGRLWQQKVANDG